MADTVKNEAANGAAETSAKAPAKTYDVRRHFDVWGDEEDGWIVNDSTTVAQVRLSPDAEDDEAVAALVAAGQVTEEASASLVAEWTDYGWEFTYEDGMPAFALTEAYEETRAEARGEEEP